MPCPHSNLTRFWPISSPAANSCLCGPSRSFKSYSTTAMSIWRISHRTQTHVVLPFPSCLQPSHPLSLTSSLAPCLHLSLRLFLSPFLLSFPPLFVSPSLYFPWLLTHSLCLLCVGSIHVATHKTRHTPHKTRHTPHATRDTRTPTQVCIYINRRIHASAHAHTDPMEREHPHASGKGGVLTEQGEVRALRPCGRKRTRASL